MVRDVVHRGRKTLWPWVAGLVVLLVALWAVGLILNPDESIDDPSRLSTEGVDAPDPVVVPAPANR